MLGGGWTPAAAAHRVRGVLGPVLQASAAAGIAWYLAHNVLGHAQPFFAPIAAAVALSTSHVQRARRSAQMIVGVLLGIGVSELLHPLLGNGAGSIAVVVALTLVLAVALGVGFVGEGMMFFNQAAASAVLVIALHRAGTGAERATDALVGGAVALVIGVGLFPTNPLKLLWSAESRVLRSLLRIIEQRPAMAGARHRSEEQESGAQDDPDMDAALAASHDVHRQLTALTQARGTARSAVRVAPRRMSMRPLVDAEERRVARMYLLASAALDLMRTATPEGLDSERSSSYSAEVHQLAGALRTLIDAPRPWGASTVGEVGARMRALLASELPHDSPADVIEATAARRVAADVLGLLPETAARG